MSFMDKAKEMLSGHKDEAKKAVDKGGDLIDDKTGHKYEGQVDTGQAKAQEYLDKE